MKPETLLRWIWWVRFTFGASWNFTLIVTLVGYRVALVCRVPVCAFWIVNKFAKIKKINIIYIYIHKPEYVFICIAFDPRKFSRMHNTFDVCMYKYIDKKAKKQLLSVHFNSNNCNKRSIRNIEICALFLLLCLFHLSFISLQNVRPKKHSYNVLEYSNK